MLRKFTVCFSGHRIIPQEQYASISEQLKRILMDLICNGYLYFGVGGALGFDTLVAQTILKLRVVYPKIKLILVLPCISQTRGWANADIEEYERIKCLADKVVYVSQEYSRGCMLKRDRHLVDNSSVCVCYLTETRGGTAYTVNYAKKCGLKVINIAEKELSLMDQ